MAATIGSYRHRHIIICPQATSPFISQDFKMEENCLVANVFVPETTEKNLPVVVYVHGGAFQVGFGNWFKVTKYAKTRNIIIVTFNYRLGAHGFLCLGTEDVPGNAGMKDQVALLHWINRNIANFGGNPKDVTIAGGSAGSAAVDLLILSKAASGLFNKAIPESGANLAAFAVQSDPIGNAKFFAKQLNFTSENDIYALGNFYKSISYELLTSDAFMTRTDSTFIFSPCVERKTGEEAFLLESPMNILKSGKFKKLPMLYGFANMEGLVRIGLFDFFKSKMNVKFSDFLPADLKFKDEAEKEEVAKRVKKFYFGDKPIDDDNVVSYVDFFSDVIFTYSTLKSAELQVKAGNKQVYLYEYNYVEDRVPIIPNSKYMRGADHCAQSLALVDGLNLTITDESVVSEEYRKVKQNLRELWSNFIISGYPIPEGSSWPQWNPVSCDLSPYMSLGSKYELKQTPMIKRRFKFWDEIYERYYRNPEAPPTPPHTEL